MKKNTLSDDDDDYDNNNDYDDDDEDDNWPLWLQQILHEDILLAFQSIRLLIWHTEDRASWYILIIKPTRCTISHIYFGIELYMFRTDLLSIIRSLVLYIQQQVYVVQVMLTVC